MTHHIILERRDTIDKDHLPLLKDLLVDYSTCKITDKLCHLGFISVLLKEQQSPQQMHWLRMRQISIIDLRYLNNVPDLYNNSRIDANP